MHNIKNKYDELDSNIAKWFAIYTHPKREKIVCKQIKETGVKCYLPLIKELRLWHDRKKWIETPIFNSYVFVRITSKEYEKVIQIPGVINFVNFSGERIAIPQEQIDLIKLVLEETNDIKVENSGLYIGQNVEIIRGILIGKKGKLIEFSGKSRLVLKLKDLGCILSITIDKSKIRSINQSVFS